MRAVRRCDPHAGASRCALRSAGPHRRRPDAARVDRLHAPRWGRVEQLPHPTLQAIAIAMTTAALLAVTQGSNRRPPGAVERWAAAGLPGAALGLPYLSKDLSKESL